MKLPRYQTLLYSADPKMDRSGMSSTDDPLISHLIDPLDHADIQLTDPIMVELVPYIRSKVNG